MKVRSAMRPKEIEITASSVLVASNIEEYEETIDGHAIHEYEYDCTIYTKDEYLLQLAQENSQLKQDIIDTQLALVELYEAGGTDG